MSDSDDTKICYECGKERIFFEVEECYNCNYFFCEDKDVFEVNGNTVIKIDIRKGCATYFLNECVIAVSIYM